MSSITNSYIQLIILISRIIFIHQTIAVNQCDFSSAPYLQSAAYSHSIVLRVQPIDLFEQDYKRSDSIIRKVLVREVIKSPLNSSSVEKQVKTNDMIIIRINDNDDEYLDNSCWHLLRVGTVDVILFLNETKNNEFDLHYPPVESTLRVRENIDAVLNHDPYSPQVLIKTRLDRAILSKDYSLQCNSRGNPLPQLLWSKKTDINETLEYYPLSKQCHRSCRIYSIQYKYQSTLFFQSLTLDDIGTYVCHAENPMNRTSTSVYLDIDRESSHNQLNKNLTCSSLQDCHNRGQCISINYQLKCLCDSQYFGERCETNYDDVIKKQDSAILLFKSRFLAGFILVLIGFCLLLIVLVSWLLARNNKQQRNKFKKNLPEKTSADRPLLPSPTTTPAKQQETIIVSNETNGIIPISSLPTEQSKKLSSFPQATIRLSPSPTIASKTISSPSHPSPPIPVRRTVPQGILTRESSIATDEDDEDGLNSFFRQYQTLPPVPTKIDEEYEERFSMSMNTSEELGLGSLMNGYHTTNRVLSPDHEEFYRTGIIKPLDMGNEPSQRYTKYVSSYSKFVLPRPVKSSSLSEYQQR
ncbi:unnamed protein product [Adineta ricciae]|uniref:Uncharacterized protein n=1 Tax=Adineta ricciae TaxID=249248 RepID=A0A814SET7_ADIRI|nr:unnamed protein product [Adineta ricciae]